MAFSDFNLKMPFLVIPENKKSVLFFFNQFKTAVSQLFGYPFF